MKRSDSIRTQTLDMDGASVAKSPNDQLVFILTLRNKTTLTIAAQSEKDRQEWMVLIEDCARAVLAPKSITFIKSY
jgi:hypothetical protein